MNRSCQQLLVSCAPQPNRRMELSSRRLMDSTGRRPVYTSFPACARVRLLLCQEGDLGSSLGTRAARGCLQHGWHACACLAPGSLFCHGFSVVAGAKPRLLSSWTAQPETPQWCMQCASQSCVLLDHQHELLCPLILAHVALTSRTCRSCLHPAPLCTSLHPAHSAVAAAVVHA